MNMDTKKATDSPCLRSKPNNLRNDCTFTKLIKDKNKDNPLAEG